uniref:Uncharacterized protein n=1 Tax=Amphimedon queenslandica TaxID=400682 RepID=A0A1X7V2J5_AMPQE
MDSSSDFPPRAHHHISRCCSKCYVLYGVDQFILISPDEKSHAISSEAQSKLLLSSISLAVANTGWSIQKNWCHMFSGQCEGYGLRTCFEMIHLRHIPPHFSHLSGLLNLFRSKLTNILSKTLECGGLTTSGDGSDSFLTLPVGASSDPIHSLSGHEQLTEDSLTRELKSAPPNSLTMRLAKAFCNIHNDYGLKAMAHIWYEVIQELRYRWENGITLPRC